MYAGSKWMVALVLVGVNGAAMAQTVYRVDFKAESERITGFIDLAANSLGPLTPSEITGWSFSSVAGDPVAFSFSSSDAGAAVFCSHSYLEFKPIYFFVTHRTAWLSPLPRRSRAATSPRS